MRTTSPLAVLFVPFCLAATAAAQVQIPINPKATYLRHENDPGAVPPPAIPLSALGVSVGQWLNITTTGAFSDFGGADTSRSLLCVFSNSPSLLTNAPGLVNRVPGAIAAGASFVSGNTYYSNLTTDLAADFIVTRQSWTNGAAVKVPVGATHLFFCVFNPSNLPYTYYTLNSDPNADYFAVFTPVAATTLPGTAEHPQLRTGVNGAATATPDVKQASAFATLSVEVAQRWGVSTGELFLIAANIYATGGSPPVGPLPDFHMGTGYVVTQVGVMIPAPGLWSFFIPPGQAGQTLILQGFFLTPTARNGLLSSSDAHRIELL